MDHQASGRTSLGGQSRGEERGGRQIHSIYVMLFQVLRSTFPRTRASVHSEEEVIGVKLVVMLSLPFEYCVEYR
jgi:hypothetical protein